MRRNFSEPPKIFTLHISHRPKKKRGPTQMMESSLSSKRAKTDEEAISSPRFSLLSPRRGTISGGERKRSETVCCIDEILDVADEEGLNDDQVLSLIYCCSLVDEWRLI